MDDGETPSQKMQNLTTNCEQNQNHKPSSRNQPVTTNHLSAQSLLGFSPAEPWGVLGEAGEYYYELFGTSSPPLPLETYKMQVKAEASGTKD